MVGQLLSDLGFERSQQLRTVSAPVDRVEELLYHVGESFGTQRAIDVGSAVALEQGTEQEHHLELIGAHDGQIYVIYASRASHS